MQNTVETTHAVASKVNAAEGKGTLVIVTCTCGYRQTVRWMAFFPSLWLAEHTA